MRWRGAWDDPTDDPQTSCFISDGRAALLWLVQNIPLGQTVHALLCLLPLNAF